MNSADDAHREWMRQRLDQAAQHFSVALVGDHIFGWRDRTIGSRTHNGRWLRVSWSQTKWTHGEWWAGNEEATRITGVPKPIVLAVYDWKESDDEWGECRLRAEVMTLVADKPCSETPELRAEIDLPDQWWTDLRNTLYTLAEHDTERGELTQEDVTNRLLAYFGSGVDPTVTKWTTAHNDLNWSNLTGPNLFLLDWESWGAKMAGYDAASLYILSLLAPDTAKKAHETFADLLDSPDGKRAQLFAISRYLKRVEIGDFHNLADKLHAHARKILSA
ncbi:MAG: aminoglycoside phosphotransferase [Pseudonocardiaceae bacterium]